ncbi:ATP synthase subunit I [Cellulosilyticum sp. ST5]|uniref:ATP synthase subunit I n=1 Tax=Cellulosilyticum sp. ST5 TaxID=3055805 RepID=UPI00397794FB
MNNEMFKKNFMLICMILFSLIVYIIGILLVADKIGWTLGITFGLVFSLLKLKLMQNTIAKAIAMPEGKAQKYANVQYMIRYILTGVVLVIAALEPSINLLGVFFGLISMKVGAYAQLALNKKAQ